MTEQKYKQTEVGLIPVDWDVKTLGDVTQMITNGFVGTATIHYSEERNSVLYIQGYNVEENSFNFRGIKRVSQSFHKNHQKSSLKEGDLLTVQTGDVGLTTIVPKELVGSNCHALIISRFKLNKVYPWFYSQYFNSVQGRNRLKGLEIGTTMKHLNVGDMLEWLIPLPPTLHEQKAIATALSDTDQLITTLGKLINKKKAIKQGVMQELLTGKTRLDGFEDSGEYKETEVGLIPVEWDVVDFKSIGTSIIGLTYTQSDVSDSGTLVHRSSNIQNNKLSYKDNVYVTSDIPDKLRLLDGDILICVRNGSKNLIGKSAIIKGKSVGETFGAFMSIFRTTSYAPLIYQFFISDIVQSQINASLGATINQITNKTLNEFKTPYPPTIDEQKAIATILSDMDMEIEKLEAKQEKLKGIKKGMMQELLTGKTRLV